MFVDIDIAQCKKYGQNAFGDYFVSKRNPHSDRLIAVLSDGLGSGVKANILACMTATMFLNFIEHDTDILSASEIIMNSLPVCQVRGISYATFSVLDCDAYGNVRIVEEGNPEFLWIRNNKIMQPQYEELTSEKFPDRHLHIYAFQLRTDDRLVFCSDGVTQAALGTPLYRLGLRRQGLIKIVLDKLRYNPVVSSHDLANFIVYSALQCEPDKHAKDDISACCVYCREPKNALVFTGPPYNQENDGMYAKALIEFNGKKAIAGGTTANLVSRELGIPIVNDMRTSWGDLPPTSKMEGIDLVTEGILTLTKTLHYLERGWAKNNAAGELFEFLRSSNCINFMVGAKLNQAHYDPSMPVEIELRKNIIRQMADVLREKYYKKVTIQFM